MTNDLDTDNGLARLSRYRSRGNREVAKARRQTRSNQKRNFLRVQLRAFATSRFPFLRLLPSFQGFSGLPHWQTLQLCFALSIALFLSIAVRADEPWILTKSDFHRTAVGIESLDERELISSPAGDTRLSIPLDEIVRLNRAAVSPANPPKLIVFLHGGDRLGGTPGDLKDEWLAWNCPVIGDVQLPLSKLLAISRFAAPVGLDADRKEDQVMLSNRDVVRGVVSGVEDGKVLIQSGSDTVPIPIASTDSILFATAASKTAVSTRAWRIRFIDLSVLTVPSLNIRNGTLSFPLFREKGAAETVLHHALLSSVSSIEQVNGPVSWLSDRQPRVNEQVPFSSETTLPARMDLNVFGKPLRIGAQTFEKGIGVHANSVLTFPLDGSYKVFRTMYAIDTTGDVSRAAVDVRIRLDGKIVHEAKNFRAFKLSPTVTVELAGAKELTLEVLAAGPTDTQDRLDWIEPALVRTVENRAGLELGTPATAPSVTEGVGSTGGKP